jgi:integrase
VHAPNTAAGRRKAETVARDLYDDIQQRSATPGTVADLVNRWVDHRRDDWSDKGFKDTQRLFDLRVLPYIGHIRLERLTTLDIDTCYRRVRRDRGLTASSIRRTHAGLHAALEQAVKWRLVTHNPARYATVPKAAPTPPTGLPRPEDLRAAIAAAKPWFAVYIRLALHTGGRTGELTALRWSDIDLGDRVLRVWQSKTKKWKVLALGDYTAAILTAWRHERAGLHEAVFGRPMPDDWPVFGQPRTPFGKPLSSSGVAHAWERLRTRVPGLSDTPIKALRKAMSTVLLTNGISTRTVMGRGGWSASAANPEASVLLIHYAQLVSEEDRRAAELLDDWLNGG